MKMLVPMDGSEGALRALQYALDTRARYRDAVQIDLINIQRRIASGNVRRFISQDQLNEFYQDEGASALRKGAELLDAAQMTYTMHVSVGDEPDCISRYAKEHNYDLIVMGTRGTGTMSNLMLGSVSARVSALSSVPVVLVK